MESYIVSKIKIEGRLDPHFYKASFLANVKQLKKQGALPLHEIIEFSNEIWNQIEYFEDEFPYIEIGEVDIQTGEIRNINFIKKEDAPSRARMIVRIDDIIVSTTRPHRGAISYIDKEKDGYIASTGFSVLRKLKRKDISKRYLFYALRLDTTLIQMLQRSSGGNYPAIVQDELGKVLIPNISKNIQLKVIQIMEDAYAKKQKNEKEAFRLFNSYYELITEFIDIKLEIISKQKIFNIYFNDLEDSLNPGRYASKLKLDKNFSGLKINNIGNIVRDTFSPSKSNPDSDYGLIRIDDLENNPQDAIIRNVKGKDINGIISKVNSNDILVARLAPTIKNKKTIVAPEYNNQLIASTEFICLRCSENINPFFVLVLLKTDFYKELMIQKSRGAIPSRRRLSHDDFALLPFPDIEKALQDKIVSKFQENIQKAKSSMNEAEQIISKAKKNVEQIIFN